MAQLVRTYADGSIGIPRPDPDQEAQLDRTYVRVPGEERRWWATPRSAVLEVDSLRGRFAGARAIVLGKGPSLERFREIEIDTNDVIAAVNEAALSKLPPRVQVAMAVDAHVVAALAGKVREGTMLVAPASLAREGVTVLGPGLWDDSLRPNMGSSPALVRLLSIMGVSSLVLIGFDGFDTPTPGKVYAPSILAAGVADRDSGDFAAINGTLRAELMAWGLDAVTFWHRQGKPRVKKGG